MGSEVPKRVFLVTSQPQIVEWNAIHSLPNALPLRDR